MKLNDARGGAARQRVVLALQILVVAIPLLGMGLYLLNPFGADSYDPRQRILGHAPYRMPSRSMAPTLKPGQIVLMRAGHHHRHLPERGELVIYRSPEDENPWIQRVIGLPGEQVAIEDGRVTINGQPLNEEYLDPANVGTEYSRWMHVMTVPQQQYLLLGDNRDNSMDGRLQGTIPHERLLGKVVLVLP